MESVITTSLHFRATRLTAATVISLTIAGGFSACGSSDKAPSNSPSDSSSNTSSTAAFVAQANGICAAAYPAINEVSGTLDPADPTVVTSDFLPLVQGLQDQLSALTPPDDIATAYEQALADQQMALDAITADPSAAFTLDDAATNATFDGIGITSCGSGSVDVAPSGTSGTSGG